MKKPKDVDSYIKSAPKEAQPKLREIRAAIRSAAPKAEEIEGATIRFPLDKKVPVALIKKLVKARAKKNDQAKKLK